MSAKLASEVKEDIELETVTKTKTSLQDRYVYASITLADELDIPPG